MFPSNQSSHVKQMNKNEQYNLINILHWGCRCFRWCKWIRWWGIQTIGSSIIHVSLLNSHIWYRQVLSIPHRTSSFATSWFIYELMCTSVWIIHLHLCILFSSNRGNDKCYFTYRLQELWHATQVDISEKWKCLKHSVFWVWQKHVNTKFFTFSFFEQRQIMDFRRAMKVSLPSNVKRQNRFLLFQREFNAAVNKKHCRKRATGGSLCRVQWKKECFMFQMKPW